MTGGQQMLLGVNSAILLLTPQTTTVDNSFAPAGSSAYVSFWPDGRVTWTLTEYGTDTFTYNWCSPVSPSNGASFVIYFEPIPGSGAGGAAPDASNLGPINTWLSLNTMRRIGYNAQGPYRTGAWKAYIDRGPTGGLVQHRVNATLWGI